MAFIKQKENNNNDNLRKIHVGIYNTSALDKGCVPMKILGYWKNEYITFKQYAKYTTSYSVFLFFFNVVMTWRAYVVANDADIHTNVMMGRSHTHPCRHQLMARNIVTTIGGNYGDLQ